MCGWTKELKAQHRRMIRKLTHENCRRAVADIASDYARWAVAHGVTSIHVFPVKGSPVAAANVTRDSLRLVALDQLALVEVDPTEWGMKS